MFRRALVWMIVAEAVSLLAFVYGRLSLPLLALIGIGTLVLSLKNLEWGVYLLFGELFFGSRGHLLESGFLSLRLVIFVAVFVAWAMREIQNAKIKSQNFNSKFKFFSGIPRVYWVLFAAIILGAIYGYAQGNGVKNVFFDANAYVYLGILPAVLAAVRSRETVEKIFQILGAAIIVIAVKTLFLFVWFTYGISGVAILYHWVINQDIGEITGIVGSASRIFMQSQFWAVAGLFIWGIGGIGEIRGIRGIGGKNLAIISAAVFSVIMSLSRSFWLGAIGGALFAGFVWFFYFRTDWARLVKLAGIVLFIVALELGALYVLVLPTRGAVSESVASRLGNPAAEAAGGARLLLLPALLSQIQHSPLFGYGFGKEVSYPSYLPDRVTADNPEGTITNYAFEWGYLDILLKVGALGLIIYLLFIADIFRRGWSNFQFPISNFQNFGILSGLVALLVLNNTTPYLNHPLGIGYLILALIAFQDYAR